MISKILWLIDNSRWQTNKPIKSKRGNAYKSCPDLAFFLNSDWLRKWRNIGHPITMRYGHKSQSNDAITFDSLLKGMILFLYFRKHTQIPWLQFLVGTFIVRNAGLEHWYELVFLLTIMVFYMYILESFQVFVVKAPYFNESFLKSPQNYNSCWETRDCYFQMLIRTTTRLSRLKSQDSTYLLAKLF